MLVQYVRISHCNAPRVTKSDNRPAIALLFLALPGVQFLPLDRPRTHEYE
jgi:hypothetical protein